MLEGSSDRLPQLVQVQEIEVDVAQGRDQAGIWPLTPPYGDELGELTARMAAYMEKATHEAKVHTSWINPDAEYDAAVRTFVAAALADHPKNRFLAEFRTFHQRVANWGLFSALAQTVLKLTSPGVPDIYQGQELWDFSLVDPDNRRPVDFARRQEMLAQLRNDIGDDGPSLLPVARALAENPGDARLKLFVTWRMLQFRRQQADLFKLGEYIPLAVEGAKAKHLCAFARRWVSPSGVEPAIAVVLAPRLLAQLTPLPATDATATPPPLGAAVWDDTRVVVENVVSSPLRNIFTGQACSPQGDRIAVADALADFPVAVLTTVHGSANANHE